MDVKELKEEQFQLEENRMLMRCTKLILENGRNLEVLRGIVVPKETAMVIASLVKDEDLFDYIDIKKEEIDMCQALIDLKKDGEAIGIEKGRCEGRKEGIVKTIIKMLKAKLGNISKELIVRIEASDEQTLDKLSIKIFEFKSEDDVYKILNKYTKNYS